MLGKIEIKYFNIVCIHYNTDNITTIINIFVSQSIIITRICCSGKSKGQRSMRSYSNNMLSTSPKASGSKQNGGGEQGNDQTMSSND